MSEIAFSLAHQHFIDGLSIKRIQLVLQNHLNSNYTKQQVIAMLRGAPFNQDEIQKLGQILKQHKTFKKQIKKLAEFKKLKLLHLFDTRSILQEKINLQQNIKQSWLKYLDQIVCDKHLAQRVINKIDLGNLQNLTLKTYGLISWLIVLKKSQYLQDQSCIGNNIMQWITNAGVRKPLQALQYSMDYIQFLLRQQTLIMKSYQQVQPIIREVQQVGKQNLDIFSIDISSDYKFVVSGGADQLVKYWDLQSKQNNYQIGQHFNVVNSVKISQDNTLVFSCSADNSICCWNLIDQSKNALIGRHDGSVMQIKASQNIVVSVSLDKTIRYWDITNKQNNFIIGPFPESQRAIALLDHGQNAAFGGDDCQLRFWNILINKVDVIGYHKWPILKIDTNKEIMGVLCQDKKIYIYNKQSLWNTIQWDKTLVDLAVFQEDIKAISKDGKLIHWKFDNPCIGKVLYKQHNSYNCMSKSNCCKVILTGDGYGDENKRLVIYKI